MQTPAFVALLKEEYPGLPGLEVRPLKSLDVIHHDAVGCFEVQRAATAIRFTTS